MQLEIIEFLYRFKQDVYDGKLQTRTYFRQIFHKKSTTAISWAFRMIGEVIAQLDA